MYVLSWNIRGMGGPSKSFSVKDLVKNEQPTILLLQEMKLEEEELIKLSKNFWNGSERIGHNSRGASGGLGTFWGKD